MEGIMNLPANVGGATSQDGLDSFAPLIAAQQAARDMGYPRFTRELLSAGSEMDQAEVQEFLQTIRDAGLTSNDVAMMRRVVEAVFGDPNNYPQVRDRLLSEGIPEDLLPEMFDLEFFVALRMAVEEAENLSQEPRPMGQGMPMDMPVGMAQGGIVDLPQMTPIARQMAAMGRNGDTMLAHITPQEAMMLQRMGGSGTINPYTGLPEFFIGKAFKGLVKGVKKFAKSTVGRIVISVALGAFLGPMATGFLTGSLGATIGAAAATGISAGIGVFGSSLLAGDGFKDSLKNGLTAGALSYAGAGIFGEAGFSNAPTTGSPTTLAEGYQQGVSNVKAPFKAAADFVRGGPDGAAQAAPVTTGTTTTIAPISTAAEQVSQAGSIPGTDYRFSVQSTTAPTPTDIALGRAPATSPMSSAAQLPAGTDTQFMRAIAENPVDPSVFKESLAEPRGFFSRAGDFFSENLSPNRPGIQPPNLLDVESQLMAKYPNALPGSIQKEAARIVASQTPGMFTKYGPLAATGIGALALTGNLSSPFEVPEQEPGESYEAYMARRDAAVAKFREERPEFFGSFLAPSNQGIMSMQPSYSSPPIITAAEGSGPKGVENFPRKNGAINGPGTGTSDDIPAMLSDGEFVFTAKSVRNMGGGSRRKGAAKMYKLMKMLEGGPVDKTAKA